MINKEKDWNDIWLNNNIPFHNTTVNEHLQRYFPQITLRSGSRILVPLCGKSLDILWLYQQGMQVTGIEISKFAVEAFFKDHDLPFEKKLYSNFVSYKYNNLQILCGDIFQIPFCAIGKFDFIYDRAAIIAIDPIRYKDYVKCLFSVLAPMGKMLFITIEHNVKNMQCAPYSISEKFLNKLFKKKFIIDKLFEKKLVIKENLIDLGVRQAVENVFELTALY